MRGWRTSSAIFAIALATSFMAVASAHADAGHVHAPPVGGGAAPGTIPTVIEPISGGGAAGTNVTGGGPGSTPAPGAQPAAPQNNTALPPAVGAVDASVKVQPTVAPAAQPKVDLGAISEPATTAATTVPAKVDITASGGGGHGGAHAADAGASAVPTALPVVTGGGDLPFTGIEETILLISLAGMLVPIGVLLYCGARRGDERRFRRHLAMPRYQWAPSPPGMRH